MNKRPCRIICYRGDRSGSWAYRLHFPLSQLVKSHPDEYNISISSVLDSRHIGAFDLAIMQRQYMRNVFEPMLVMKQRGMKLVYEIDDDLFNVPKWNPAHKTYGKKSVRENFKYFLSNVDAIFVSTKYLADLYSPYCEHIYILPNSIDPTIVYSPPNNAGKKVVCWQGSQTHQRDVALMKPALQELKKDDDVFLKLWSYDMDGIYKVPFVPFDSFYVVMSQLDMYIGLAPLTTLPFNKSKSNLKFLEYSFQGVATIASDFGPYADTIEDGETGILVSDNRDWYDAVRHLIDDEDEHDRLVRNAKRFVEEHYTIQKNYILWKNAIDEVMEGKK